MELHNIKAAFVVNNFRLSSTGRHAIYVNDDNPVRQIFIINRDTYNQCITDTIDFIDFKTAPNMPDSLDAKSFTSSIFYDTDRIFLKPNNITVSKSRSPQGEDHGVDLYFYYINYNGVSNHRMMMSEEAYWLLSTITGLPKGSSITLVD